MKKLSVMLFFILFSCSSLVEAAEYLTRMIDVNISKNGDVVMNQMVKAFDKVPVSLEKISLENGFSNQFSFLITSEVQTNGLIKTEVFTKIINRSNDEMVTTAPKDVAKVFLLTAEKPAQYKIGPYLIQLLVKGEMLASASNPLTN